MPPKVDMSLVREALQRRLSGAMGGGQGAIPALGQRTMPGGVTPTGGANTPMQALPNTPTPNPSSLPQMVQTPQGGAPAPGGEDQAALLGAAQGAAGGPQFDDETKSFAKALMAKLIKGL